MFMINNQNDTIKVKMLGGFSISFKDRELTDDQGRTKKVWTLIEYLLANYDTSVSQERLIEAVWPEEEYDNPLNALKNLVYRARTALKEICPPDLPLDFILFERNTYAWNPKLFCEIDIEQMESLHKSASDKSKSIEERIADYEKAIALYNGEFLPKSSYLDWVIGKSAYYASLYLDCVLDLIPLYNQINDYEKTVILCEAAIVHCPYEENIHQALLVAYGKTRQKKKAIAHYQHISKVFYDEFGIQLSDETTQIYKDIVKEMHNVELDLSVIMEDLKEAGERPGAFFCDYNIFKQIYQLQARSVRRTGLSIHVALLTLTDRHGNMPSTSSLKMGMKRLKDCVVGSLRKGDVVAPYSAAQLVIMLPLTTYEDGNMVLNRIAKKFDGLQQNMMLRLNTRLSALAPVDLM